MYVWRANRLMPVLSLLVLLPVAGLIPAWGEEEVASVQGAESNLSEMRLDDSLIEDFLNVIYFTDNGRLHLAEYSECSYEYVQNPSVSVEEGVVRVGADYYRRQARETLGACVGGPGTNTRVNLSARVSASGRSVAIEVFDIQTESLPELTAIILDLAGVQLPLRHEFDLLAAVNGVLYGQKPFGLSSLQVHDVVAENESVLVRMSMEWGVW